MRLPHIFIPEKKIYQILLLCTLVLLIYYPAIFAEISIVDDLGMVNALLNTEKISFWDLFVPRSAGGGYYRPLLGLSQYIDKQLWMMSSSFMHLENILLHLVNVLLVYLLTFRLSGRLSYNMPSLLPFAAALVFAIHPIATESVNWISGRTDIMACNFILVSAIFLFRYLESRKKMDFIYSGVALLLSLFAKEVAFGYILALPFLLSLSQHDAPSPIESEESPVVRRYNPLIVFLLFFFASVIVALYTGYYWIVLLLGGCYLVCSIWPEITNKPLWDTLKARINSLCLVTLFVLATFALFFVLRKIAFTSNIDRISNTVRLIFYDTSYAISLFMGAAGFYVKKFFVPLPLNFFILEIDPLYDFLGIAVFLFASWLILKRSTIAILAITGMCCVLPALPFAFGTIAWTGYAERYIYVASSFWSIALALFIAKLLVENNNIKINIGFYVNTAVIGLLMIMGLVTYQRNVTWQTNMALISDTVTQNPRQKELRGLYMLTFIRAGDLKSAKEQYHIASSLHSVKYLEDYDLNMAGIKSSEGNKAEAEVLLKKVLDETRGKSVVALKFYTKFLENELNIAVEPSKIISIQNKIIPLYNQLYELNHDPFIFYRLGQIYIARNDNQAAVKMFERAAQAYPAGTMYGDNSSKIVKKMKSKSGYNPAGVLP